MRRLFGAPRETEKGKMNESALANSGAYVPVARWLPNGRKR
ncbi:hypothetical protein GS8_1074 [Geobacillus stearothermophilus]|uniref:Uncharacterized protein n=1 Tax=Geobacillus stearothermophilus TaxID=1422 RepID=A0ABQ7HH21_GEOSE|nr:hypothetical protein GS8_1074 [Geobacillus stearothermophilus]